MKQIPYAARVYVNAATATKRTKANTVKSRTNFLRRRYTQMFTAYTCEMLIFYSTLFTKNGSNKKTKQKLN